MKSWIYRVKYGLLLVSFHLFLLTFIFTVAVTVYTCTCVAPGPSPSDSAVPGASDEGPAECPAPGALQSVGGRHCLPEAPTAGDRQVAVHLWDGMGTRAARCGVGKGVPGFGKDFAGRGQGGGGGPVPQDCS